MAHTFIANNRTRKHNLYTNCLPPHTDRHHFPLPRDYCTVLSDIDEIPHFIIAPCINLEYFRLEEWVCAHFLRMFSLGGLLFVVEHAECNGGMYCIKVREITQHPARKRHPQTGNTRSSSKQPSRVSWCDLLHARTAWKHRPGDKRICVCVCISLYI